VTTPNRKVVAIDYRDTGFGLEGRWPAVVIVDVIRSATTAITAITTGRRCFPVPSIEAAVPLAARLDNPLLAGELGGSMPYGFELHNSPAAIAVRDDIERPLILLSTSGTRLLHEAAHSHVTYAACLRNAVAQANHLAAREESALLLGAATRGEFREEDILCCARIGRALVEAGYRPSDARTEEIVEGWGAAADDAFMGSASVAYLEATEQQGDLDFILEHIDDVDGVFEVAGDELAMTDS
jgi:2-phosphosulfolactate phosphatase